MIDFLIDNEVSHRNLIQFVMTPQDGLSPLFVLYRNVFHLKSIVTQSFKGRNLSVIKDNKILSPDQVLLLFSKRDLEKWESELIYNISLIKTDHRYAKNTWERIDLDKKLEVIGFSDYISNRDLTRLVKMYLST